MTNAQILAYAAPVIVTLAVVGMGLSTKRRLNRRKAKIASEPTNSEIGPASLMSETSAEMVFVTEVEPGTFKSQPVKDNASTVTGLVMRINAVGLRGQMTEAATLARAARDLGKVTAK